MMITYFLDRFGPFYSLPTIDKSIILIIGLVVECLRREDLEKDQQSNTNQKIISIRFVLFHIFACVHDEKLKE